MKKEKSWADYFAYLIWAFFLFTAIYDLFYFPIRSLAWIFELAILVFAYYRVKVPGQVYFSLAFFLILGVLGELYLELFYNFFYYDKILHFLFSILIGSIMYFVLEKKVPDKEMRLLFGAAIVLSFELIWEILEYTSDLYFGTFLTGVQQEIFEKARAAPILSAYPDTIYDMLNNFIGVAVFLVGGLFLIKKIKK